MAATERIVTSDIDGVVRRYVRSTDVGGIETWAEIVHVEGISIGGDLVVDIPQPMQVIGADEAALASEATLDQGLLFEGTGVAEIADSISNDTATLVTASAADGHRVKGLDDAALASEATLAGILSEVTGDGLGYLAADATVQGIADSLAPGGDTANTLAAIQGATEGTASLLAGGVPVSLPFAASDAFGRLRVSQPSTIFDAKCIIDAQPLAFSDVAASGSGTSTAHSAATSSVVLGVGNLTAGKRVRQTRRRFAYQPGKSQQVFVTFTLGAGATGITREVGLADDSNGVLLRQTASGLTWLIRSKATGNVVETDDAAQAEWDLDTLDGSADAGNPSGILLDPERSQIAVIDFEWLGVGSVRVGFVIDGVVRYVHAFHHANRSAGVYMSTPNLPVRWSVENDGSGGAATFEAICASVASEGGLDRTGLTRTVDRAASGLTTLNDSDLYPLIALRLAAAGLGATVRAVAASVFCTTSSVLRWALLLNPTVSGSALSFSGVANSAAEADVARTNGTKVSGGTVLASGYAETTSQNNIPASGPTDYALGSAVDGTSDVLVLAVQRLTGTTETFYGTLTFSEQV